MTIKIDFKSVAIGLLLGVCAMLAVAAGDSPAPVGRYQATASQNTLLILDTATGESWATSSTSGTPAGFFQTKLKQ